MFEPFLEHETITTAIFFLLGAILGSFANVVILRLPAEKSIVKPGSRCGSCGAPVKWHDNIPIVSWFVLRGRCRACQAKFSIRYPLVEFITAVLFAAAFAVDGFHWSLVEHLIFIWALVVCTFIDIDHMILPDEFTLSGIVIGLAGALLNPDRSILDAFLGVLAGGGFLWFMAWLYFSLSGNEGMGGGDIKLLGWIGAVLGVHSVPFVIMFSAITGSVLGLLLTRKDERGLKAAIPYGPYLAGGAVVYMLMGQDLAKQYWSMFLP